MVSRAKINNYPLEINELIIEREIAKERRDSTPNGHSRNELTFIVNNIQAQIKYRILRLQSQNIEDRQERLRKLQEQEKNIEEQIESLEEREFEYDEEIEDKLDDLYEFLQIIRERIKDAQKSIREQEIIVEENEQTKEGI